MAKWRITRTWYVDAKDFWEAQKNSKNWDNSRCHVKKLTDTEYLDEMSRVFEQGKEDE